MNNAGRMAGVVRIGVTGMYHTYVLRSQRTNRRYVGHCTDLPRRLNEHNTGQSKATRHGAPWTLIHTESFETKSEAVNRELYFKTGKGRDELDRLKSKPTS
jgi:putative endonuclease